MQISLSIFLLLTTLVLFTQAQWKTAGTTRYWDCNQPFCQPGKLPYPHSYAMKQAPSNDPNGAIIYGTAAASDSILKPSGSTAANCEKCYLLKKSGTSSPKIVVKVNNWCPCQYNPSCCTDHFDIAVPGFDYAAASASNVCQKDDSTIDYSTGHQRCQNWYLGQSCDCSKVSTDTVLQKGCSLFLSLNWDNPSVDYQPIACPSGISGEVVDGVVTPDDTFPVVGVTVGVCVGAVVLVVLIGVVVYLKRRREPEQV